MVGLTGKISPSIGENCAKGLGIGRIVAKTHGHSAAWFQRLLNMKAAEFLAAAGVYDR